MKRPLRPRMLDDLIGREPLKKKARVAVGAALARGEPLPHVLLTSNGGGLGKTSFAQILANEMYSPLVQTSGPSMASLCDLRRVLIKLRSGDILHIDEIHAMAKQAAEELLLVLEEGVVNLKLEDGPVRVPLPRFTLIASTTMPSALSAPLTQRFGLSFHFEFYTVPELTEIAYRMSESLRMPLDRETCTAIAERSLGIPRVCLRHVERVRDVAQACGRNQATMRECALAMEMEGVDRLGLGPNHHRLLEQLARAAPRGISARSVALALGVEQSTITAVLEPTLVRLGLMVIRPGGRFITNVGMEHLRAINQHSERRALCEHLANILRARNEHSGEDCNEHQA